MSKIAIISQPDQGVLIDVSGCDSIREAVEHLSSTLQVSSQFWKGTGVALNLGQLELNTSQIAQILAITKGVGAFPKQVFSKSGLTRAALKDHGVTLGTGEPMELPKINAQSLAETELLSELLAEAADEHDLVKNQTGEVKNSVAEAVVNDQVALDEEDSIENQVQSKTETAISETPAVLYLRQNLRSGQTVSHKGHLVIVGDVNPGAEVMAEGDITVWGALRGVAHAGIVCNLEAEIRSLKLQPIQIRIAHAIARSPDSPRVKFAVVPNLCQRQHA